MTAGKGLLHNPMEFSSQTGLAVLIKSALKDVWDGVRRHNLWAALAMEDVLDTYRHTSFGVAWAIFSFSFFSFAIILAFGLDGQGLSSEYVAHLVTGLLIWNFISSIIGQAPTVFVSNHHFVKGSMIPLSVFALQLILRTLILTGFSALGATAFLAWSGFPQSLTALASIPAVAMYVVTALPVQLLLGSLGAFTRDVQQVVENVMRALFFLTPVIWLPAPGTLRHVVGQLNPITHYIEIFRMPIVEGIVPWSAWLTCLLLTALLWAIAVPVFSYTRKKIVFWI